MKQVKYASASPMHLNGDHVMVASPPVLDFVDDLHDRAASVLEQAFKTTTTTLSKIGTSDFRETIFVDLPPGEVSMVTKVYDNFPDTQDYSSISIESHTKVLLKFGYALKQQGADADKILNELSAKNILECTPHLPSELVTEISEFIVNHEIPEHSEWFFEEFVTHASVAKSIVESHGEHLRYASDTEDWYEYDKLSGFWKYCDNVVLGKFFLAEIKSLQVRVHNNSTFDFKRKNLIDESLQKAKCASFAKGVILLLPSVSKNTFKYSVFDSDPYLVGLPNKQCLDLKTVNVRSITPSDNLTKSIGPSYDVNATCPLWEKSILEWCCGDKEQVLFLQTLVGYSLSGLMTDQRLYFLYGNGKNGKSVFVNILSTLFGQNGLSIDPSSLMDLKRSSGQANGDIARLVGKRFISSNELPNNGMFNEELIKRITSGDTTVARQLYKSEFEFAPVGKLFISGNNQPIIRGRDEGIWRRMTLIPFDAKITSPDRFLDQKLKNELSGIFNWAIEGWEIFAMNNMKLITPISIKDATAEYRSEMDILGRWKEDCLKQDNSKKLSLADIYASYKEWCINESISPMSSSSFNRETKNMFVKKRERNGYVVSGYCLCRGGSLEFLKTI